MKKPKMIACDLDGTLLLNGAQVLQENTCALIHRLYMERGIRFAAASGRQYLNLQHLFEPIKDEIDYVCENGCVAFSKGERIFKATMGRELGNQLIEDILKMEGAEVLISGENTSYILEGEDAFYHHVRDVVGNHTTWIRDFHEIEEPYFKISIFEKEGLHDVDFWKEKYESVCTVQTGGEQWLDVMPKNINKKPALEALLKKRGIEPEDLMAFGDNDNDSQMLDLAGIPCSVNSGKEAIRAKAVYLTDTVEHAFENMLEGKLFD